MDHESSVRSTRLEGRCSGGRICTNPSATSEDWQVQRVYFRARGAHGDTLYDQGGRMSCSIVLFQGCSPHPMALRRTGGLQENSAGEQSPALQAVTVEGLPAPRTLCFASAIAAGDRLHAGDRQHLPGSAASSALRPRRLGLILASEKNRPGQDQQPPGRSCRAEVTA